MPFTAGSRFSYGNFSTVCNERLCRSNLGFRMHCPNRIDSVREGDNILTELKNVDRWKFSKIRKYWITVNIHLFTRFSLPKSPNLRSPNNQETVDNVNRHDKVVSKGNHTSRRQSPWTSTQTLKVSRCPCMAFDCTVLLLMTGVSGLCFVYQGVDERSGYWCTGNRRHQN